MQDLGERLYATTNAEGAAHIREQLELLNTEYNRLKSGLLDAKSDLETTCSQWSSFDHSCELLSQWLNEVETKLRSDTDLKSSLPEKKSALEKVRMLAKDIQLHQAQVRQLEERCAQLQEPHASDMLTEVVQRYGSVSALSSEVTEQLESDVAAHEAFINSYQRCLDWISASKQALQRLADTSGSRSAVQERMQQLEVRITFSLSKRNIIKIFSFIVKTLLDHRTVYPMHT